MKVVRVVRLVKLVREVRVIEKGYTNKQSYLYLSLRTLILVTVIESDMVAVKYTFSILHLIRISWKPGQHQWCR